MVPLASLWMPILVSAVLVFFASFLIHMVLRYHRGDYRKVANEDAVQESLRRAAIPPGDYFLPHATGPEAMKDPAYVEKRNKGPIVLMTVIPGGPFSMGSQLLQWFIYCVIVSVIAAYIAGRALPPAVEYLEVFRFAGTTAFVGYALALWQNSIWYKKAWTTTLKQTIDGLIYGLLTGGAFGWLWPRV